MNLLLIDDDALVARSIARVLRQHQITSVTDAREALSLIASGTRYDAILCDLRMPGMGGEAFYRALAATEPEQAARVIFASGDFDGAHGRFLADLPNLRLSKPFSIDELRRQLDSFLRAGAA